MTAVFALVCEVFGDLRFLWQKITFRVRRNLGIDAFGVAVLAAQDPFRIGSHFERVMPSYAVENRADT
jgi:hypothetical protein